MKKLSCVLLFIAAFISAKAGGDYYNTPEFWTKLVPDAAGTKPPEQTDTSIVVVSNRAVQNDSLRFMSEERDGMQLRYYYVYALDNKWHVLPVASIAAALNYLPDIDRDWVLYTEGMGKLFTTDLYRAMNVAGQYKVNVLLFDYPSITTTKKLLGNYYFALSNAKTAYKDFAPVFEQVKELREQQRMGSGKLSMFFHSMGNNVIAEIVKNGALQALNDVVWVDNLILNAPCIDQSGHAALLSKIAFARRIYIHYNPEDHTLKGAHLLSLDRQLGEKVDHPIYKNAVYINFNMLAGEGHSNFLSIAGREPAKTAAIRHYTKLLQGDSVNVNDQRFYKPTAYKNIGWDILP